MTIVGASASDQLTDLQRYYVGGYYDPLVTDTYSYRLGAGTTSTRVKCNEDFQLRFWGRATLVLASSLPRRFR
jgi:hypothetical protein